MPFSKCGTHLSILLILCLLNWGGKAMACDSESLERLNLILATNQDYQPVLRFRLYNSAPIEKQMATCSQIKEVFTKIKNKSDITTNVWHDQTQSKNRKIFWYGISSPDSRQIYGLAIRIARESVSLTEMVIDEDQQLKQSLAWVGSLNGQSHSPLKNILFGGLADNLGKKSDGAFDDAAENFDNTADNFTDDLANDTANDGAELRHVEVEEPQGKTGPDGAWEPDATLKDEYLETTDGEVLNMHDQPKDLSERNGGAPIYSDAFEFG